MRVTDHRAAGRHDHGRRLLAVERLRPVYGGWGAFEAWAPQNVNRALIYLITGE